MEFAGSPVASVPFAGLISVARRELDQRDVRWPGPGSSRLGARCLFGGLGGVGRVSFRPDAVGERVGRCLTK